MSLTKEAHGRGTGSTEDNKSMSMWPEIWNTVQSEFSDTGKSASVAEKEPDRPAERGHETVLLVEDELAILEMTTIMLERLGYTVLAAGTPGEAIRLAREHSGTITLLMTDVVMPEMNGRQLAGNLLAHYPDLKRLFMSGYTANVIVHHGVLDEGAHFIQKPFSKKDLGEKLREALKGRHFVLE